MKKDKRRSSANPPAWKQDGEACFQTITINGKRCTIIMLGRMVNGKSTCADMLLRDHEADACTDKEE